MGLDMYLYAKKYENRKKGENNEIETENFYPKDLKKVGNKILNHNFMSKQTSYQIGYWRKFNALQGYFLDRVEDEEELLKGYYLSESDIIELIEVLEEVKEALKNKTKKTVNVFTGWANGERTYTDIEVYECEVAQELLPPTPGFFYGSEYIDDYYIKCLDYSLDTFKEALHLTQDLDYDIIYEASW